MAAANVSRPSFKSARTVRAADRLRFPCSNSTAVRYAPPSWARRSRSRGREWNKSKKGIFCAIEYPLTSYVNSQTDAIFSISAISASTSCSCGTFRMICPLRNTRPSPFPPAIPTSAAAASPGPFTAQPITATVIGSVYPASRRSTSSAMGIRSMLVRPQVGQAIRSGPSFRSPAARKIFFAA